MALHDDLTALNNMHDLVVDSRQGYLLAAERADDDRVKALLASLSDGRAELEAELDDLIHAADPEAEHRDGGTIKGELHRAWMAIRETLNESSNANVLAECERGEKFLLMRYDEMLQKEDLDQRTTALMRKQQDTVQRNVARIHELRERFEKIED